MKRVIAWLMVFCLLCPANIYAEEQNPESIAKARSMVLMEASSGTIISAENEEERLSPASITKIMTLILIFDAIRDGKIKMEDMATTSAHAKSMGGSQVFLEEGEQQTVETLIKCIIIASGNDASVTMAELIAGSEEAFVEQMNQRAEQLGMENTHFVDCCGLTDADEHYTTAKDVAVMSRELITKYPQIFQYSTIWMESITHRTKQGESEFVLTNTNKLLKTNQYVKGLKTGSTSKAKYCVSTVAEKNGVMLIAVVMAAPDYKSRFAIAEQLLNFGFSNCKVYQDQKKCQKKVNVLGGRKESVVVESPGFSYVDTAGGDLSKVQRKFRLPKSIVAPIKKGEEVGQILYTLNGSQIGTASLIASEEIQKTDFAYEFLRMFGMLFQIR